jgi:hypothetical protein
METAERMFFFVRGMGMLFNASLGQFRVTEPAVCDNKLVVEGSPLSTFVSFEKFEGVQVDRAKWVEQAGHEDGTTKNGRNNQECLSCPVL